MPHRTHRDRPANARRSTASPDPQHAPALHLPVIPHHATTHKILALQRMIGNHAVTRLFKPQTRTDIANVQRVPQLEDFKEQTHLTIGRRNKIKALDQLVADYNNNFQDFKKVPERLVALGRIQQACQTYLDLPDKKAKRKVGVRQLFNEVQRERPILNRLLEAQNAGESIAAVRLYMEVQETLLTSETIGQTGVLLKSHIGDALSLLVNKLRATHSKELNEIAEEDVESLREIVEDKNAPELVKTILGELLANMDDIYMKEWHKQGAREKARGDMGTIGDKKYVVEHKLFGDDNLGKTARLGGLTHELTHVSAGESYKNTVGLLLYKKGTTPETLHEIAKKRGEQVTNLYKLTDETVELNQVQKTLIRGKLDYANTEKADTYAENYERAVKLEEKQTDSPFLEKYREAGKAFRELDKELPEGNTVFVEFDSVINQILIYLYLWKIPSDHPLFVAVGEAAKDAYDLRKVARN